MALTASQRQKRYKERHPERVAAYQASASYKASHAASDARRKKRDPGDAARRQKLYRERHPERVKAARIAGKEKNAAWRSANKDRVRMLARRSYRKNREKRLAYGRLTYDPKRARERGLAYRSKNRERLLAKESAWRKANPQKCKEIKRRWIEKNKDYYRARCAFYGAERYNNMKQARPKWANPFFMREIYHLAILRSRALGVPHHVDHIVPIKSKLVCGLHVENNMRVIPARTNIQKSNITWPDMP